MDFNKEMIVSSFREFWRLNKDSIKFKYKGKEVTPEHIEGIAGIQVEEGDFGDGFNFLCHTLNLRVMLDSYERTLKSEFYIKVTFRLGDDSQNLTEKVIAIKDDIIFLKDK